MLIRLSDGGIADLGISDARECTTSSAEQREGKCLMTMPLRKLNNSVGHDVRSLE